MKRTHLKRGVTVVEISVAASLFLVVTTVLLAALFRGVQAWKLAEQRSTLIGHALSIVNDIQWELESSHLSGVEWDNNPGVLTFVSPFGTRDGISRDTFQVNAVSGVLRWSKYVVVYHDVGEGSVMKRELAVPTTSPAWSTPQPLSTVDLGSGVQPLSFYASGGKPLASEVEEFAIQRTGRSIEVTVKLRNKEDRRFTYSASTVIRN